MDRSKLLIILLLVLVAAILLLVSALILSAKKGGSQRKNKEYRPDKLYFLLIKVPILGRYIRNIRVQIECTELLDEDRLQKKTLEIAGVCLGISLVLLTVLIVMDSSLLFIGISLVVVVMLQDQISRFFVSRMENALLKEFTLFLTIVRHKYNEHHMVDEAIYDAIDEVSYNMARQATRMYETLTDEFLSVEDYYDVAPNRYFKSFVALSQLVLKFGDQKIGDGSSFLKNLNYLKQEISMELLQKQKINYLLSSMTLMTILPLFFVKPLEKWAMNSMPDLMNYYEGRYGYIAIIILFVLVVLSYQLIIRLRKIDHHHTLERYELPKVKILTRFIQRYINTHYNKAIHLDKTIKLTGQNESVESFYYRRVIWGVTLFVITIFVFVNLHQITRENILEKPYLDESLSMESSREQEVMDASIIVHYKITDTEAIRQDIKKVLEIEDDKVVEIHLERITQKMILYHDAHFKWWEFLVAICIGVMASFVPAMMIQFQKGIMLMHMEDEVLTFHTVILMLMPIKRMAVVDLLEWMALFAVLFKEDIQQCLNDYELGDIEALEALKERTNFKPFTQIINNLQATADKITIAEAFDELIVERGFYQEKRKQDIDILIEKKGAWGRLIAFVPMAATIGGFLLVPFTHLGIYQFEHYLGDITGQI